MSTRVTGSFRDPSGYVFDRDGRIFRAIDPLCDSVLRDPANIGLVLKDGAVAANRLTATGR